MSVQAALKAQQAKLGQVTHVGPWLEITQERIDKFAEATGDYQWIHVDPERARRESPMGATIAHGFLTLSLIPFLTGLGEGRAADCEGMKMALNYGLNRVRFVSPVPVGSRLRATTKLIGVEEVAGGLQITNEVTIEIDGGKKPACVAESLSRIYF
ncbi:Enoyl-CoA hydratase [Desulfarculus baarsii DSM 2075]|uniref:Enoyl-CoA hydratase n=1 Tax=Desulfarculus baarsii (strain ATCC 33931 / DSM 2075 / LMG 7858 / VKM B-1802 / 2st14) TaxID=644282 RepID=E1QIR0_DESB2|nr:MaoC family dehydratase [Desulfarculus baarsii]ADK84483.1 Enoyl-CoA hydratase [Desulfarculus baarsii DSM 2075]